MKRVIYIFGITATGKTSAGKLLTEKLNAKFVSVDEIYHQLNLFLQKTHPKHFKNMVWPDNEKNCPNFVKEDIREKRIELYNEKLPKEFLIASAIDPPGSPPPFAFMLFQNNLWLS